MKLLQIHSFGTSGRDRDTLDACIDVARTFGFDALLVKALDGVSWMSDYDGGRDAISSADEVAAQRDRCHAAGLKYFTWTVPLHDVDLALQAQRTSAAALNSDGLFLDVEPYDRVDGSPPFWGPLRPVGLARSFMQRIRDRAPDAWLCLQPDPRPARLAEIRPDEWMPFVDAFSGQHYWTDFDPRNPANWASLARLEMTRAAEIGRTYGKPVLPTLPGISPTSAVPVDLLGDFGGFVVFRLATTADPMLRLLGGLTLRGAIDGQPTATRDPFEPLITTIAYLCDTLGDQIFEAAARLDGQGEPFRKQVAEMRRVRAQMIGERPQPGLPVPVVEPTQPTQPAQPSGPTFDPNTPAQFQPNGWACSVFSATMALASVGIDMRWQDVRAELGPAVSDVREPQGLQDARGPALVSLFQGHGFAADAIPWNRGNGASWDDVLERAGRMPVLLGGRNWNHWTFVRGVEGGMLSLGNPARNHMGVDQLMSREQFGRLGVWTMVWIDLPNSVLREDPVRIQQLETEVEDLKRQVQEWQDGVDALSRGLAHVADKVVPELVDTATPQSRRAELLNVVKTIRETLVGAPDPAPAPGPTPVPVLPGP